MGRRGPPFSGSIIRLTFALSFLPFFLEGILSGYRLVLGGTRLSPLGHWFVLFLP